MSVSEGPYILRNADTSPYYYQLVSAGDSLGVGYEVDDDSSLWYLAYTTPYEGYFRLYTRANGETLSLDVINDNDTSSTRMRFYETGDYTGQFWRLDQWSDGTYKLSNSFTGPDAYLDLDTETLAPYLNSGVGQAPSWEFIEPGSEGTSAVTVTVTVPPQASATSVLAAGTQTISTTASTATPSLSTVGIPPSHGKSISLGAIVGIAIGSLAALTLCVCAVIYVLRRKRTPTSADQHEDSPELVSDPPNYVAATSEKVPVSTHVAPQGKQGQDDQEWRNIPSAEIADTAAQHRAEMP